MIIHYDTDLDHSLQIALDTNAQIGQQCVDDDEALVHRSIGNIIWLLHAFAHSSQFTPEQQCELLKLAQAWDALIYGKE